MEKRKSKLKKRDTDQDYIQVYFGEGSPAAIQKLMQKLYGRVEPKVRTIEQVHALWLRAVERRERNRANFRKIIFKAVSDKPDNKKGYRYMHFYREDSAYRYRFSYEPATKGFSYITSPDCVDNDEVLDREDFVDKYLDLNDEERLKIADEFIFYNKLTMSRLSAKVFDVMWKMIENSLRERNKDEFGYFDKVITIKISDCLYHIDMNAHGNGYVEYKWRGEVDKTIYTI